MTQRVGPFELLKSIGTGGMAEVWSAVHAPTHTLVAIKYLRQADDPRLVDAFRREVRAAAALDHPHIARIHDQGVSTPSEALPEGTPWLAMELARNGTLRDRRGTLGWPALSAVLLQVLDALAHAHARGLIHRDIKPDNVLMGEHGPLIADFGLAHRLNRAAGEGAPTGGSPAYMAPEQFRRSEAEMGPWTDLYGVGCLAWALSTGKPPFTGLATPEEFRNAHAFREPPAFSPRHRVPLGFEAWVRQLLAKAPAGRPRWAADAAEGLRLLGDQPAGNSTSGPLISSVPPAAQRGTDTWHDLPLDAIPTPVPAATRVDHGPVPVPPMPTDWRRDGPPARPGIPGVGLGLLGTREVSIVGRESQRDALWDALAEVHATRRPRAVILSGPAGIGTDRLAQWLARRAHGTGAARILFATHSPVAPPGAGLAWVVANLLRSGPIAVEEAADRVTRSPDLAELTNPVDRAAVSHLIGCLHEGRPASRGEIDAGMGGLLRAVSTDRPVLLWLARAEHSATSLAFVGRLLDRAEPAVLVVISVRDEDVEARPAEMAKLQQLRERDDVLHLPLGPLPLIDRPALVRSILPLEPGLASQIEQRTAGHPGFVSELIRDLVHRGLLLPTDEGYAASGPIELPADLAEAWSRRLDDVLASASPETARALHVAALLWSDLVDATWDAICARCQVPDATVAIEPLLSRGLAARLANGGGWSFAAGLRDALLAHHRDDLEELHRICADVVRVRDGGAETEAHHLLAAGDSAAAIDPLLRAARERLTLGHYDEALALLRHPGLHIPEADPRSGSALVLTAAIHRYRGEAELEEATLEDLGELLDTPGWEEVAAEAAMARGARSYQRGKAWEAVEHLREAEDRFIALGRPVAGLPACRVHLADCLMRLGRLEEARDALELALDGYRGLDHRAGAANAMLALGGLGLRTGELDDAERWLQRAATAYAELGVRFGLAETHNRLGELARQRSQMPEAERLYRLSAEGFDAIGASDGLIPRLNLGLIRTREGRWAEAVEALEASAAQARTQHRDLGEVGRVLLLPCYAALARWPLFDTELSAARKFLASTGMVHPDLAEQAWQAAELCEQANQSARAKKVARIALDQWRRLQREDRAREVRQFLED